MDDIKWYRWVLFFTGVMFSMKISAQGKDTLFLKDGQILIGKLKGMMLGKADFDADNIDLVDIKADKIKTITAITHLYKLETIGKQIYYTHLQPAEEGNVYISANDTIKKMPIEDISELTPLRGKTGALWQGNASAGYSFTRSSAIGRINGDFSVGYRTRRIDMLSKASIITTQTDSSFDVENATVNVYGSYLFNATWQAILLFSYQHNLELGLARRYQEGIAAGFMLLSSSHSRIKIMSGLVLNQEKSTEGVFTPTQMEAPFIILFDFYHFRKPDITLSVSQSLFAGITQWGRFRQDGQVNLSWKIIGDLSISLQVYDNYDNQPPGENAAKLDYGVVFGLSYKFSQ